VSNIRDVHIITNDNYVICQICNKELQKIDGRHTKKIHQISFVEYKTRFPNKPTITSVRLNKELEAIEKRRVAKKSKENSTKFIVCCNKNDCNRLGQPFVVNINVSNNHTLCPDCKKRGIENLKDLEKHQALTKSMLKKYGVTNPSELQFVQEIKKENLKQKLKNNPDYFKLIVQKRIQTIQQKYGNDWKQILHEMSKEAMLKEYGKEYALQVEEFLEKQQSTYFSETGYKTPFENPDVQEEIKKNNIKKFGVINPMQDPDIARKVSKGLVDSWKDPEVRRRRELSYIREFIPRLTKFLEENANLKLLDDYQNAHYSHKWKCLSCQYIFNQNWNAIQQGYLCPNCRPPINKEEKYKTQGEIADFIQGTGVDIVRDNRSLISPYELDILIHSKKIAIEYCGLFWHNEEIIADTRKKLNDPTKYHLYKLDWCEQKGYKLITIFEDEWIFKKSIVKARLKQILGKSKATKIHARKCEIFEITASAKNKFLGSFHVQGKDYGSSIFLGAFFNDILVSVMTFSKGNISKGSKSKEGVWELNRFCSDYNYHSAGIAGKLLEHFKRHYNWTEIFSYADRRWSVGHLYKNLGFDLVKVTEPNYWYIDINKLKRYHRFSLRKKSDEPKDITERVLRISQGYKVIWDCGNLKFSLKEN
jgi:hypothetical protein